MREIISTLNPLVKTLFWIGIFLMLTAVSAAIALGITMVKLDIPLSDVDAYMEFLSDLTNPDVVWANKVTTAVSQIVGFLGSALLFLWIFGKKVVNDFWLQRPVSTISLVPLLAILSLPLIEASFRFNQWLIPDDSALAQWAKPLEDQAEELTNAMLAMDGGVDLFWNIILVALIPAICEEFAFRGVLQSQLAKAFNNVHVGIWISAFLFSAIHFQFYGFIPRMLLGALFGYMLIWTGSMWAPMVAHFTNNALSVLTFYFYQSDPALESGAIEEASVEPLTLIIMTVLLVVGIVFMIRKSKWPEIKTEYLHTKKPGDAILGEHRLN